MLNQAESLPEARFRTSEFRLVRQLSRFPAQLLAPNSAEEHSPLIAEGHTYEGLQFRKKGEEQSELVQLLLKHKPLLDETSRLGPALRR